MNPYILIGGALLVYLYLSSQSAPAVQQQVPSGTVTPNPGTTTPPATGTTQVIPPPATNGTSIQTWTDAQNAFLNSVAAGFAAGDSAIVHASDSAGSPGNSGTAYQASPFVLAFYFQHQAIPELAAKTLDLSGSFPGVDLSQNMSSATFWNHIAPWLASSGTWAPAQGGAPTTLSGLGYPSMFMNPRIMNYSGWEV